MDAHLALIEARLHTMERRARRTRLVLAAGLVGALAAPFALRAQIASLVPFSNGTVADAAAVNANFEAVAQAVAPVGAVLPYAGDTAPTGWLFCNGAEVSRTTYAELFARIGTRFGAGNGTSTFNLPDLRGRFVRGFDAMGGTAAGVDPGRVLGSTQNDGLGSHGHAHTLSIAASGSHFHGVSVMSGPDHNDYLAGSTANYGIDPTYDDGRAVKYPNLVGPATHTHANSDFLGAISPAGGGETRPKNVALGHIIRY